MALDIRPQINVPDYSGLVKGYQGSPGAILGNSVLQGYQAVSPLVEQLRQRKLALQQKQQWADAIDQLVQQNPHMAQFAGAFKQDPSLMGQVIPGMMKPVKQQSEWGTVPGMISKSGRPMIIDKFTGEVKESGPEGAQSTGYGSTMGPIRQNQLIESLVKDARDTLNPYFTSGPAKQQAERLDSISRIEPLIDQMMSQPGGGDPRQMREAATAFNKVLQGGGTGAEGQIESLVPQTGRGRLGGWLEWFTNQPQGLEQQAFIKRYADSVAREKNTIRQRVEFQAQKNAPTLRVLKKVDPESYQAVLDSVFGQFGSQQASPVTPAPTASQGLPIFNSEQDAVKANLPKGTRIMINGRAAVIE